MKRSWLLLTIATLIVLFPGCVTPRPLSPQPGIMAALYEAGFKDFMLADPDAVVAAKGGAKDFPYASFDEVWDAAIRVVMQQGVILCSNKAQGIIAFATPLYVQYVLIVASPKDDSQIVHVHLARTREMLETGQVTFPGAIKLSAYEDKNFMDSLATQVYSGTKWRYLTGTSPQAS